MENSQEFLKKAAAFEKKWREKGIEPDNFEAFIVGYVAGKLKTCGLPKEEFVRCILDEFASPIDEKYTALNPLAFKVLLIVLAHFRSKGFNMQQLAQYYEECWDFFPESPKAENN